MTNDAIFVSFRRLDEDGALAKERTVIGLQGDAATAALLLIGSSGYGVHVSEVIRAIPRLTSIGIIVPAFSCELYDGIPDAVPQWYRLLEAQDVQLVEEVAGHA